MGSLTRESFLRVRIRAKQSAMDIAVIRCRRRTHHLHDGSFGVAQGCRPGDEGKAAPGPAHLMQKRALIAMQYSALHNRTWITPTVQKPCRNRAKTVQKPCTHGLQNKKAMKSFDFMAFSGAMEGTRTPGLLIRRNRIAHFVHFIIQRQIVVLIESQLFFRCYSVASFALLARLCTCYPSLRCAENVQKCAAPKSARQNRLFRTAPKAGFQRYLLCKIFQFYPNNNLT